MSETEDFLAALFGGPTETEPDARSDATPEPKDAREVLLDSFEKAEVQLQSQAVEQAKTKAAYEHGLGPVVAARLQGSTPEEVALDAKRLATELEPEPEQAEAGLLRRHQDHGVEFVESLTGERPRPLPPRKRPPGTYDDPAPIRPRIEFDLPTSFDTGGDDD